MQYPLNLSAVCGIFSYLCNVFRSNLGDIHIDESVFALSLTENVKVFNNNGTTSHFLLYESVI